MQAGDINYADARVTLELVLARANAKGLLPQHLAWPSLAAAIALLAATDQARLEARARCGFSHRCVLPLHQMRNAPGALALAQY